MDFAPEIAQSLRMNLAAPFASVWWRMSLASRYGLASALVLIVACLVVGSFVTRRIEDSVVRNTASATALYMESFVAPISQQLAENDQLSENAHRALEEVFTNTPLGEKVVSYKIWKDGGRIVEATDESLIGQVFEVTGDLARAWQGEVSASFEALGDEEDAGETALGLPLLEIYSPIRAAWSGEVIAVAEFYEINYQLKADLVAARRSAWLSVAAALSAIGLALYSIVLGGSRTIERQRRDLDRQFHDLEALSARNRVLRLRVQEAAAGAATATEQGLRRIGADLHDGPAQYLAYAALRLDDLRDAVTDESDRADFDSVHDALSQAMTEVRAISRGLSLPEISDRSAPEVMELAATAHEARNGVDVETGVEGTPGRAPSPAELICIYRFVQEGLNNATRHGGGTGLSVQMRLSDGIIDLRVADSGPGFPEGHAPGLGLNGLRNRVESLGGHFTARNRPEGGAEITMSLSSGAEP